MQEWICRCGEEAPSGSRYCPVCGLACPLLPPYVSPPPEPEPTLAEAIRPQRAPLGPAGWATMLVAAMAVLFLFAGIICTLNPPPESYPQMRAAVPAPPPPPEERPVVVGVFWAK